MTVLVVDDDSKWRDDLKTQAESIQSSGITIVPCATYADGIKALETNKNIDVALVDYYLDNDQNGLDFIDKSFHRGNLIPYLLVSHADELGVLSTEKKGNLAEIAPPGLSGFLEKRKINSISELSTLVRSTVERFAAFVHELLSATILSERRTTLASIILLQEVEALVERLKGFRVDDEAFLRVADSLGVRAKLARDLLRSSPLVGYYPPAGISSAVLAATFDTDAMQVLQASDMIPTDGERRRIEKLIRRNLDDVGDFANGDVALDRLFDRTKSLFDTSLLDNEAASIFILSLACQIAGKATWRAGLEYIYRISRFEAERHNQKGVARADLLAARYLMKTGHSAEATRYLASAWRMASRSKERELEFSCDALTAWLDIPDRGSEASGR